MISSQFVPCASSSSPVHARNGQSQEACNETASKDVVQPRVAPVEEEAEREQTRAHRDARGTPDMRPVEMQAVVRGTVVSKIVHFGDSCSSTDTAQDERYDSDSSMPAPLVEAVGDHQSKENDHNRNDSGQRSVGRTVVQLDLVLAITQPDRTVANKVHAPDGN